MGFGGRCWQIWYRQLPQVHLSPGRAYINVNFRSFLTKWNKIDQKIFFEGFLSCWSQAWHAQLSQVYLMLRALVFSVIFRSFPTNSIGINWQFLAGSFRGGWLQIWHRQQSQEHVVPGVVNINVIFRSFCTSRKEIDRKIFLVVFGVVGHKYNTSNFLRCTWCLRWRILIFRSLHSRKIFLRAFSLLLITNTSSQFVSGTLTSIWYCQLDCACQLHVAISISSKILEIS